MSRKMYFVILSLLVLTLICTVGAATWVIASPAFFDAAVSDNIEDSANICLSYCIAQEDGINDELRAAFGELPTHIQSLEFNYKIWMPNGVTKDSIRNNRGYSHAFLGWFVGDTQIESFETIKSLYLESGQENFILTAHWQAKACVDIEKGSGGYADSSNSGYYMPGDVVTVCITNIDLTQDGNNIYKKSYLCWTVTGGDGDVEQELADEDMYEYKYTLPNDAYGQQITITDNIAQKVTLTVTLQATGSRPSNTASVTISIYGYPPIKDSIMATAGKFSEKTMKQIYLTPGQSFKIEASDCSIVCNGQSIASGSTIEVHEGQGDIDIVVSKT